MQTRSGFSSQKICNKFKTNGMSSPWYTSKTFLQKKKKKKKHSHIVHTSQKMPTRCPCKIKGIKLSLLSAWPVKKSTPSIVLYRGGGIKDRTLLTASIPPSNPLNPIWLEVIYSFVKSTSSAPWSLSSKPQNLSISLGKAKPVSRSAPYTHFLGTFWRSTKHT